MSTICPSEAAIPPEAFPPSPQPSDTAEQAEAFSRFAEEVDQGLVWDPDSVPRTRLHPEESLILDIGGLTPQTRDIHARRPAAPAQPEFWRSQTIHKNALSAKLREAGRVEEAAKLELCHSYYTICQCSGCNKVTKYPNRCDLFFCPECQGALTRERARQVKWWTQLIKQPKHVVLTVRNIPEILPGHVDELRKWFTALRRRKFARGWRGGFYSIQVTNKGNGWHLHIHAIIDANWIDKAGLALSWDSITHGAGRIVEAKDARDHTYLDRVTNYVAQGQQIARWETRLLLQFLDAFTGKRTFGVFGGLYAARTEFAEFIATIKAGRKVCECGCKLAIYYSEADWILHEAVGPHRAPPRIPLPTNPQVELFPQQNQWFD